MFLSFFLPLIARFQNQPDYLWVLLKQAASLSPQSVAFIADETYFKDYGLWRQSYHMSGIDFKSPSRQALSRFKVYPLSLENFSDLCRLPLLEAFYRLITEIHPGLVQALEKQIRQAQKDRPIRALLSWVNVPSLSAAAQACGLPVLYNELGPLRPFNYRPTVYFDFQGVNGDTSTEKEARLFYAEFAAQSRVPLLPLEQIRNLLLIRPVPMPPPSPAYAVGIPLQYAGDSNVIAFHRGMTLDGLIRRARQDFPSRKILVRKHPAAGEVSLDPSVEVDRSQSAYEFLIRCERVYTLNSSVAFECLLFEKPVHIFGDSPAAFLSMEKTENMAGDVYLSHTNYLFICHLTPADFLFDEDYYAWRLTRPALDQIYLKHLGYWQKTPRTLLAQTRQPPPLFRLLRKLRLCETEP